MDFWLYSDLDTAQTVVGLVLGEASRISLSPIFLILLERFVYGGPIAKP